MMQVTVPLVGLEQTFLRPIVASVTRDLKKLIPIRDDLEVKPGREGVYTMKTTLSEDGEHVETGQPTTTTIEVNVAEEFLERDISATFISQRNELPILLDEETGLEIKPVRMGVELRFEYTISSTSRSKLISLFNTMRLRVSQNMTRMNHRVTIQYVLPRSIGLLITEVHSKREQVAPYGQTFQEYLFSKTDGRVRWITNDVGKHMDLSVRETWNRLHGRFEDVPLPGKPEFDQDSGLWSMSFTYVVEFDKPTHIHAEYPIIVNQQLLDPKFVLPKDFTLEKDEYAQRRMMFDHNLKEFELQHENHYANLWTYFRVPLYDRWQPPDRLPGMVPLWTALCALTEDDSRSLLNLRELGDIEIDPELLDWIAQGEYQYITKGFGSILFLGLYQDGVLRDSETLSLDSDLNLVATEDLGLRKTYHVVMYLMTNPTLVAERSWYTIRKPEWTSIREKLEYAIQMKLTANPGTSNRYYMEDKFMSKDRLHHWAGGYGPNFTSDDARESINWNIRNFTMYTVMTSNLVAVRLP